MTHSDELREARNQLDRLTRAIEGRTISAPHSPRRYVGQVITPPTNPPPVYVDTHPVAISGNTVAGALATFTVDATRTVPVLILGQPPIAGQKVLAKNYRGRWECYLGPGSGGGSGGGGGILPGCFCDPIPSPLTMISSNPAIDSGLFQSCTFTYGSVPACYDGLGLGTNAFLSVESFPDVTSDGALFQYLLTCEFNQFNLSLVYCSSPEGTPFRSGLYYDWLIGGPDNTCEPFRLTTGTPGGGFGPVTLTIAG